MDVDKHLKDAERSLREEILATILERMDKEIRSWDDLYGFLFKESKFYTEAGKHEAAADSVIALLLGFVHALKNLPEEGDALVIAKETFRIAVMEPVMLGVDVVSKKDIIYRMAEMTGAKVALVLAIPEEDSEGAADKSEGTASPDKQTLH